MPTKNVVDTFEVKSYDTPDEKRRPSKSVIDIVTVGDYTLGRFSFEPGWKWSECIKPVVNTRSCELHHEGMVAAGRMHVRHDDGTELEIGPGDAYVIEPGHDAWIVGSEVFVGYEFDSKAAETFARS